MAPPRSQPPRTRAARSASRWSSPGVRAAAIAKWDPFKTWPSPALLRLARAAKVTRHRAGKVLVSHRRGLQSLLFVLEGTTEVSISDPSGRSVVFLYDASTLVYGLAPLLDGGEMMHGLVAVDPVTVMTLPNDAVLAELGASPALWQTLAVEMCSRYRRVSAQMTRQLFDTPRVQMATLLLMLAEEHGTLNDAERHPVAIRLRMSQTRMGEMLAISRQWTSQLVREMTRDGLLSWRYGQVTLHDVAGLRTLAGQSVSPPPAAER